MGIPLLDLTSQFKTMREEILKEMTEICDSQRFILGPKVESFEKDLAAYCRTPFAVGVTSGSDALLIALMVEKIGAGDEVITTPFTFFATAGAIARTGAKPVFVDVDPVTFNIDPAKIEAAVTPRTKAIIPVHLFGQCADMDAIMEIANRHNLIVIEDACQSIGAEYKGRRAGSMGHYGAFSFFPSKNLGCFGDGGGVSVTDENKAKLLKIYRNHGQSATYYHDYVGGNFRLDSLQAAILDIKLRHLDSWSEARQKNAAEYDQLFKAAGLEGKVTTPGKAAYPVRHIYNQYSILIADGKRDAVKAALAEKGIGCAVYYPVSLHQQPCFAELGYKTGDMPVAEKLSGEILALPIFPETTSSQREEVVEAIAAAL